MTSCLNRWSNLRVSACAARRGGVPDIRSAISTSCCSASGLGAPGSVWRRWGRHKPGRGAECGGERFVVEIAPERAEIALLDEELVLARQARSRRRQYLDSSCRCPSRGGFARSATCRPIQQSSFRAWRSSLKPFYHGVDDVFVDQGDAQTLAGQLRQLAGMLVADNLARCESARASGSTAEKKIRSSR